MHLTFKVISERQQSFSTSLRQMGIPHIKTLVGNWRTVLATCQNIWTQLYFKGTFLKVKYLHAENVRMKTFGCVT